MFLEGTFRLPYASNITKDPMQPVPKEWLVAAAHGDTEACDRIYEATCDYVYSVALRITGNSADAEEVAQDVFLKAFKELRYFRFESSLTTWLYRITTNHAISALRKGGRIRARQVEYNDALQPAERYCERPDAPMDREHDEARIRGLLEALNPEQRACIVLREIEGLRYHEIADVLGIRINTVRSRLRRARRAILALAQQGGRSHDEMQKN